MGLDLTIAKTKNKLNLCELVSVYDVISRNMDWYLGDDKSKKYAKYLELVSKAVSITKKDVVNASEDEKDLEEYLKFIPNETFDKYLDAVKGTMGDFSPENSHLFFSFDKLSFESLSDTCSWTVHNIFKDCKTTDIEIPGQGDSVMELDKEKIIKLGKKWKRSSFKISLAKWIGYFKPEIGYRITQDLNEDLGCEYNCCDANDLTHYKEIVLKVYNDVLNSKDDERIWMISSY